MAEILIGTSGYSNHEWLGTIYKEGSTQKEYLSCYAGLFSTVELDFTYHAMPKAEDLTKLLTDGGQNLTFAIKAHKTLTHEINPNQWEKEAKACLTAIEPLLKAKRLEAVLFEFPYSFQYSNDSRRYLDKLLKYFKDVPAVVEFWKSDWYSGKVIEGMKNREIPLVSLDLPELPNLPPTMDVVTAPVSYIRLYGRNKDAWWGTDDQAGNLRQSAMDSVGVHARYDYLYTDSEIEAWADRIKRISDQAQRILVYFNNHPFGKAVRNAQALEKLLRKMGLIKSGGEERI